jgi:hypothetical protein
MTKAAEYPTCAAVHPPSAAPSDIRRKRDENISALPASKSRSPVMFGTAAFFAASKNVPKNESEAVHTYAIQTSSGRRTSKKPSATTTRSKSVAIITVRRDQRSTKAPASGAKRVNGVSRARSTIVVASGSAFVSTRTNPSAAMKLNQLPSSEMTCPIHNRRKERLRRRSWV